MKKKNWALFQWAIMHLKIDAKNDDRVYKKCLRNRILLWLMDLSGVTPADTYGHFNQMRNDILRRDGLV